MLIRGWRQARLMKRELNLKRAALALRFVVGYGLLAVGYGLNEEPKTKSLRRS